MYIFHVLIRVDSKSEQLLLFYRHSASTSKIEGKQWMIKYPLSSMGDQPNNKRRKNMQIVIYIFYKNPIMIFIFKLLSENTERNCQTSASTIVLNYHEERNGIN